MVDTMKFPVLLYRGGGSTVLKGICFSCVGAKDQAELEARQLDGYHLTLDEAIEAAGDSAFACKVVAKRYKEARKLAKHDVVEDDMDESMPTMDELRQKADELGIKYHPKIRYNRLLQAINARVGK